MVRDFRDKQLTPDDIHHIVEGDKADILQADIVLVYPWKSSTGTAMEILFAWAQGKKVYVVFDDQRRLSPWITYHCHKIFPTMAEAIAQLKLEA